MRPSSISTLLLAVLSPVAWGQMPTLTWDASRDLNGDNQWSAVEDPTRSWSLAAPATPGFGPSDFPGAGVWFNSVSGAQASLDGLGGSTQNVSWELVFRPVDFNGNHVLFETGGNGDGSAFVLQGAALEFRVQDANAPEQRIIATHSFGAGDEAKFHHIVASVTLGAGGANRVDLFVNAGAPVASLGATGAVNDWAGGDAAGLGRLNGGLPTGQTGFDAFAGDIALLRYYQGVAMSQAQVQAKFDELSEGEADSDADGLPDFWEEQFFENLDSGPDDDNDGDRLNNEDELAAGTDPTLADSDGDGLDDADELDADPPTSPGLADTDGDGLNDGDEIATGTDPTDADSDGDGFDDGLEVAHGTDPSSPGDPQVGSGPQIIWVSENFDASEPPSPDDSGWTMLLELYGFDVRRRDIRDLDVNPAALDELNAADLVIVSRDTNSGNYNEPSEVVAWNTEVTKPLIQMSVYLARSTRWLWFSGAGVPLAGGNDIEVADPGHPIFNGVVLDGDNRFTIVEVEQVNVTDTQDAGNGTVLATDAASGGVWIAYWDAGVEFYPGSGQTTGAPRLWFAGGVADNNPKGGENFTFDGEIAFINAVNFMLGETGPGISIQTVAYDQGSGEFTLTWNSKEGANYGIFYSTDLVSFDADIDDSFASQGETTSFTFGHPEPGATKLFFRVVEN